MADDSHNFSASPGTVSVTAYPVWRLTCGECNWTHLIATAGSTVSLVRLGGHRATAGRCIRWLRLFGAWARDVHHHRRHDSRGRLHGSLLPALPRHSARQAECRTRRCSSRRGVNRFRDRSSPMPREAGEPGVRRQKARRMHGVAAYRTGVRGVGTSTCRPRHTRALVHPDPAIRVDRKRRADVLRPRLAGPLAGIRGHAGVPDNAKYQRNAVAMGLTVEPGIEVVVPCVVLAEPEPHRTPVAVREAKDLDTARRSRSSEVPSTKFSRAFRRNTRTR